MVKYCIKKYPKGSLPSQQTDGRYINGTLYENLEILSKNIVKDLTFLGIIFSSTYEVGTGKSTLAQHIAECHMEELMPKFHNITIPTTMNHIVFSPQDLITRAFEVPKYSCVIVDEWEDSHYWSQLGITLREFFRKCRQLNLFIILIIPNFFHLPKSYAITRSIFAIDVHFTGEFERGHFKFYNFDRKRELYLKGKKEENYYVVKPNFNGDFTNGYVVDKEEYEIQKRLDLERHSKEKKKITEEERTFEIVQRFKQKKVITKIEDLAWVLGMGFRTIYNHLGKHNARLENEKISKSVSPSPTAIKKRSYELRDLSAQNNSSHNPENGDQIDDQMGGKQT